MAKTKIRPWDATEHLETEEDMALYLEAALEDGDPALVAGALGDIARAKGMSGIARETGLGRESLYKALSPEGNPEFATVLKIIRALGLRLHATAEHAEALPLVFHHSLLTPHGIILRSWSLGPSRLAPCGIF
jgi:probable addiction module antidote protein